MSKDKIFFAHTTAVIDKGSKIGEKTRIWHFSHIMKGAQIGNYCNIGQNVFIGNGVKVGNNVKIQNNVSIYDGVILENNVFCGPSVTFTNVFKPRSEFPVNGNYQKTIIEKGATIGANSTIICGIRVGKYALIGAGSVVTKDVSDYSLVFGNPARFKSWICECGNKLKIKNKSSICSYCKKAYRERMGSLSMENE